jgi:hypothetical protein
MVRNRLLLRMLAELPRVRKGDSSPWLTTEESNSFVKVSIPLVFHQRKKAKSIELLES